MEYIIDTNSLINNPHVLEDKNVILLSIVLRELEKLELKRMDSALQYGIRVAKRMIDKKVEEGTLRIEDADNVGVIDGYADDYVDNMIVKYAVDKGYGIITEDVLLRFKAMSKGVEVLRFSDSSKEDKYTGFKCVSLSEEEVNHIYQNLDVNEFDLLTNQYLAVFDKDTLENKDLLVWTGEWLESILKEGKHMLYVGESGYFKRTVARDIYQSMAIDSLRRNQVTMIRGSAGSGKTLISLSHAWKSVKKNEGRLVIFFNPAPSRDSVTMGFNKGTLIEKANQSSLGSMLRSKFGDEYEVARLIEEGTIELLPFTDMRGWDSNSERHTTVLISEAQNLTTELMKLGLQRISEDTQVIIDGDFHQQVDKDSYLHNNGMKKASEVLRGSHLYGEVELQCIYRSVLASLADQM